MKTVAILLLGLVSCSGSGGQREAYLHQVGEAARLLKSGAPRRARSRLAELVRARPHEPLGWYVLASLHLMAGRLDSAADGFRRVVALDASLAEAHGGLGLIRTYRGEFEAASQAFGEATDLDAGNPVFHYDAGIVFEHRGLMADARTAFEAALEVDPWNSGAHEHMGGILLLENRPREALGHYEAAIRLSAGRFEGWYGAARAQIALGQDSLALVSLQRALQVEERADVLYQMGLLYRKLGDVEAARVAFDRFQALQPQAPKRAQKKELKIPDPDAACGQLELGRLYARRRRPAAAAVRFSRAARMGCEAARALEVSGEDPAALERRAGLEAMRARCYPEAAGYYRMATRLNPDRASDFRNLGLALASMARNDEAESAYERALDLDPDLAPAYNDLALVLSLGREQHEEALRLLHQAVQLAPDEKVFLYNLGHTYFTLTRFSEAAAAFERVLQLDSTSALTHMFLGMVLARSGRTDEAEAHLKKALTVNPEYADAYFELGKVYSSQGRRQEARVALERCIELVPQHKYAHYALGQVYRDLGMEAQAQEMLRQFRNLKPHRKQHQYLFFAEPDTAGAG